MRQSRGDTGGTRAGRNFRTHSRPVALASMVGTFPLLAAACGAGGPGGGAPMAAPAALCQKLMAVLSDGPDPGADPVGYALSQIQPLGQIHTSDGPVGATLSSLIAADRALVRTDGGGHAAKKAIARAFDALNASCPGVAP